MAIQKITACIVLWLLLFGLSGCHVVTQDDLSGTGLAPDPDILDNRTLVILPTMLPKGRAISRYIWAGTQIESTLFNYFQCMQDLTGSIDNIIIRNSKELWDFYGVSKPSKKQQIKILQTTLDTNKAHWLTVSPEDRTDTLKKYTIPTRLKLNVIHRQSTAIAEFEKGNIVLQSELTADSILKVSVYDSISEKMLDKWSVAIPKRWAQEIDHNPLEVTTRLKPYIKASIERITHIAYIEMFLPVLSQEYAVYIDGHLILSPSAFLSPGTHNIFISLHGEIIKSGTINMIKSGILDFQPDQQNQGQTMMIKSNPTNIPLFIDETYMGLTPVSTTLSQGTHYLRLSTNIYAHLNYILNVSPYKPIKELGIDLQRQDQSYLDRIQSLHQAKIGTFMSAILTGAVFFYAHERSSFYRDKYYYQLADKSMSKRRYYQFMKTQIIFGSLGVGLGISALVLQILEYQARDVGIGVDEDENLGIKINF